MAGSPDLKRISGPWPRVPHRYLRPCGRAVLDGATRERAAQNPVGHPLADEADARLDRARALYVDAGDGRVDVEPAIRQVAAELGLDPDDVLAEARAILAEWDAPPGP